jgi:hypothetical protein
LIVVDEYVTGRVVGGDWHSAFPDEELACRPATTSAWFRLSTAVEAASRQIPAPLTPAGRDGIRHPDPEVLTVLDTRQLPDEAARITARFGGGWLIGETLAAELAYGHQLYFGNRAKVGPTIIRAGRELGIRIQVAG